MKKYVAEFITAFFLVFAGTGAIVADQQLAVVQLRSSFGLLGIALAYGLALTAAITAVGRISGGYGNPAVSVSLYIAKRLTLKDAGAYIGSQFAGGLVAALAIKQIFASDLVGAVGSGAPGLGDGIGLLQGGLIEVILTFILVLVIWSVVVDSKGPVGSAPLAVGLTATFCSIVGGTFTGAAMNPAYWFGPAVAGSQLNREWPVWVLGPLVGALIASTAYELFFLDAPGAASASDTTDRTEASELSPTGDEAGSADDDKPHEPST